MASKMVDLEQAARMLGMSAAQVNEMRTRSEIYGYRDGSTWKFKIEELERVAGELGISLKSAEESAPPDDDDLTSLVDLADLGPDADSILVSEEELGQSAEGASSTIIGKGKKPAESDIDITSGIHGTSDVIATSDVSLSGTSDIALTESSIVPGSAIAGSDVHAGGKKGKAPASPDLSDLAMADEISLEESGIAGGPGSDAGAGSAIDLTDDEDLVLGGSDLGSDLTLGAAGSGIGIGNPDASGIDLEEVAELGGSSIESLALPEEDDGIISLEDASLDPDAATQIKPDHDFLLNPAADASDDEDGSGSQVIALEDSAAFESPAAAANPALDTALVAETNVLAPLDNFSQPTTSTPVAPMAPAQLPEAPYSIWNVLSLSCIVMLLALTGMLMTDVMRNMWSWESANPYATGLMTEIVKAVGWDK